MRMRTLGPVVIFAGFALAACQQEAEDPGDPFENSAEIPPPVPNLPDDPMTAPPPVDDETSDVPPEPSAETATDPAI